MAPAGRAEAIGVFLFKQPESVVGTSGALIRAGNSGSVCPIVNRTRRVVELATGLRNPANLNLGLFLGTCSVAQGRIHRSRASCKTNREKVAARPYPTAGAVSHSKAGEPPSQLGKPNAHAKTSTCRVETDQPHSGPAIITIAARVLCRFAIRENPAT
jgi:hypothetical protein